MTVKELIEKLKELQEDLEIWASDDNGDLYPADTVFELNLRDKIIVMVG